MAKARAKYTCQQCGATFQRWMGRCTNCGEWNSLVEVAPEPEATGKSAVARSAGHEIKAERISDVKIDKVSQRIDTGIPDLNTVLGGGLMSGGVTLIAGQPGIGKSTILMQISSFVAKNKNVLYASGEESASQVKLRAERLGATSADNLFLTSTTSADDVAATIASGEYDVAIVDSMQTMSMAEISSAPGTVSQITNCANIIIRAAKRANTSVILVGHITKQGSIAGPKVLEHLVDVVLSFEGDRYGGFKMIRAVKPGGYIYSSFKYGEFEGDRNGRYFTDFTEETFQQFMQDFAEVSIKETWISVDVRPDRGDEKWLNVIIQRLAIN